jgi:membrane protein DedA with SNARE-associated domain
MIIQTLISYLHHYGYGLVFISILFEDFGLPLPGETMLIAASILAGTGQLNIFVVQAIAFAGAVIGDNIGYGLGYYGGRAPVTRYGSYVFITEKRLNDIERFFQRYGDKVVAVARFIGGLRQLNGIVAGIGKMPWPRFLLFNVIGAALWVGSWTSLAYILGRKAGDVFLAIRRFEIGVVAGLIVLAVAALVTRYLKYRRSRK